MNKIQHIFLLVFIAIYGLPSNGMLLRTLSRSQRSSRLPVRKSPQSQSPAFYSIPAAKSSSQSSSSTTSSFTNPLAAFKDKLLNWYKTYAPSFSQPQATSLGVQSLAPLSVSLTQPKIPQAPMATAISMPLLPPTIQAQIESDENLEILSENNTSKLAVDSGSEPESFLFSKLLASQSLDEMKNVLKYQEEIERNKQKELLNTGPTYRYH